MNLQKVLIYLLLEWLKGSLGSNLNRDLEVQNFQQQVTKVSVTGLDCSNPIEILYLPIIFMVVEPRISR